MRGGKLQCARFAPCRGAVIAWRSLLRACLCCALHRTATSTAVAIDVAVDVDGRCLRCVAAAIGVRSMSRACEGECSWRLCNLCWRVAAALPVAVGGVCGEFQYSHTVSVQLQLKVSLS